MACRRIAATSQGYPAPRLARRRNLVRYGHAHGGLSPWHGRWEVSPPWARAPPVSRPGKAVWARTVYYDFLGRAEDVTARFIVLGLPTDVFEGTDREGRRIELLPCRIIGQGLEYGSPEYAASDLPNGSWYSIWRRFAIISE